MDRTAGNTLAAAACRKSCRAQQSSVDDCRKQHATRCVASQSSLRTVWLPSFILNTRGSVGRREGVWAWRPFAARSILRADRGGAQVAHSLQRSVSAIARRHSVDSVLIVGVDGVVGANCAAILSATHSVMGVARQELHSIFCPMEVVGDVTADIATGVVRKSVPSQVIYCGTAAESCWNSSAACADELNVVEAWLRAATEAAASFTLVSSDAVFTGPWMFHAENSQSYCKSPEAQKLRQIEEFVLQHRPDALVVRTHAFGWEPTTAAGRATAWMETVLHSLQSAAIPELDFVRHASPILATDLALVIAKAWSAGLSGIYHIAGAERANPVQFAQRLAHQFGLGFAPTPYRESLSDPAQGFGRGETSLQTRKIRRELSLGLPMLSEGIQRLFEQSINGHRARLQGTAVTARVA
ncbi:MAG: hypothetical protein B7Z55_02650 [Planctomycetales bacterium 12-60-4]|nr:MAG: hypothetical protein B7Z55_02650 [Planctomycetales bacterium 12-60-4]